MPNLDETIPSQPNPPQEDSSADQEDTQKIQIEELSSPSDEIDPNQDKKAARRQRRRLILLSVVVFIVVVALAGLGGYFKAINDRVSNQESIVQTEVADQFLLGLINYERGEYELARQRFEYILQIDPNNAVAREKLTDTLLKLGQSNTLPTPKPSQTVVITATPDMRALDEIYNQALAYKNEQNWDALLDTLDSLRARDAEYQAIEVDGMYYIAYRNRGIQRIQVEGNLEGGIFDLSRAELFGPLDVEAINYRDWAGKYLTGVSFWEIDWQEVINYLSPLSLSAPYLSDSSHFTVQDRLATAQVEVNISILETARYRYSVRKFCEAYDLFTEASYYIQLTDEDLAHMKEAENQCYGVPETETPPEATVTPSP